MSSPRGVYLRLPSEDKRTLILYGWMTLLTVVLVVFFLRGQSDQTAEIQSQRRTAYIKICQVQNTKHRKLYGELRVQRESNQRIANPTVRAVAERQSDQRAELIATLEPWQNCVALANARVK